MLLSSTNNPLILKFTPEESICMMKNAGFDAMDFYFNENPALYNEETDSALFKDRLLNLRKIAEDQGMVFNQAHAPFASGFTDAKRSEDRFQEIVRSMRNASYLGIPTIVVHPLTHVPYSLPEAKEQLFEMNMDFYHRLLPYCEAYGIKIALENMWSWQDRAHKKIYHCTCSKPEEFIRYLDTLNNEWFTACLDIGHACLVCENPADFIRSLGAKRLTSLHVHDVDGIKDLHTFPYFGIIDWKEVMKALHDIGYCGDLTFEVCGEAMNTLPSEVLPSALKMLVQIGRHLIHIKEEQ